MKNRAEKIKFAIIGLGFVGKRHATMVQRHLEAELVGFCDLLSKEELGLEQFGEVPLYQNIEDLLKLDFDVLCVCSPNGLHAEHAMKGLDAKRHVVVEKPMGLTKASCEQVIYKSLNVSRHVFVVMQNRYSPPSVWIKEVIDQKLLGDISMVQINCYWNRDDRYYFKNGEKHPWKGSLKLDGGTLFTQFSHFIDIMYWLFGDITNIQAKFKDFNHQHSTEFEDSGFVSFDFINGGMGSINYSTAVYQQNMESSLTIIGSKGSVKIGGQYMNEVEYCNIENYELPELPKANPANDYGAYKGSAANHVYLIENVVDVLKGRKSITTNALEGLKVVEIIEKIYALKS